MKDRDIHKPDQQLPWMLLVFGNLLLAAVYSVAGWLGEQFTIEPGNVSLFFTSAGIAIAVVVVLGNKMLPGVLLGSLCYNVWFFFRQSSELTELALLVSFVISLGSTLQAWCGAILINRCANYSGEKVLRSKHVLGSCWLCGPAVCLIASLIGATSLVLCGFVPASDFLATWSGWWLGDLLGVLLIVPVVLAWQRSESDHLRICGAATIGVIVTLCLWNGLRMGELRSIHDNFHEEANIRVELAQRRFISTANMVIATRSLFDASDSVSRAEFERFARPVLGTEPALDSLKWVPRVTAADRELHETQMSQDLQEEYWIREAGDCGQISKAAIRAEYFPIQYFETRDPNCRRIGVDIGTWDFYAKTFATARDCGEPTITLTDRKHLKCDLRNKLSFVVPQYRHTNPQTVEERRESLAGFVVATYHIDTLSELLFPNSDEKGFAFSVFDKTNRSCDLIWSAKQLLNAKQGENRSFNSDADTLSRPLFQTELSFAQRQWLVRCVPTERFFKDHRTWMPFTAFLAGLAVTAALAWYFIAISHQQAEVQRLVDKRTEELFHAVEALHVEAEEHRRTATRLAESNMNAQAANRSKSEFLANMSHELRTPLTAIIGYAELLTGDHTDQEFQEWINTIRSNGQHLLSLIKDVLDLAKIEANRVQLEEALVSPEQMAAEVFSLLKVRAEQKGLALELVCHPTAPDEMHTDPTRLRQILVNLVGNAIKFTEYGYVRLEVTGRTENRSGVEQHWVEFSVTDTGIGIDARHLEKLFQPFTQADMSTTRKFGGTGLGLSISKRLANLLGGDIAVVSEKGSGSQFRVWLPSSPAVVSESKSSQPLVDAEISSEEVCEVHLDIEPSYRLEQTPLTGHILLAEDRPDNYRLISCLLRRAGAEVTIVENGRLAVERVGEAMQSARPFDMILMDIQMPEMDGFEAAAQLRASGFQGAIIALTANAQSGVREKCLAAGFNEYLTKPIVANQLLQMVQRYCEASRDRALASNEAF